MKPRFRRASEHPSTVEAALRTMWITRSTIFARPWASLPPEPSTVPVIPISPMPTTSYAQSLHEIHSSAELDS